MQQRVAIAVAAVLLLGGRTARADEGLDDLVKTFADDQRKLPEREDALAKATNLARALVVSKPERVAPFKEALKPLLAQLATKRTDGSFEKLTLGAFAGLDVFTPFPDLGPLVKPFLHAEASSDVRGAALRAIEVHGASGVVKELAAILQEKAKKDRLRELVERAVVACTGHVPTDEAEKVLITALEASRFKNVKRAACAALGDLNQLRPSREVRPQEARAALVLVARATNPDADVSAAAALALLRFNSFEGIAEEMKRLEAPKGDTRLAYRTICEAAHQPEGFLNLPPERFYEAGKKKDDVIAEVKLWWANHKAKDPDFALFEALRAAGVAVPRDTAAASKEAIAALIDGLGVADRSLRYAALDVLVRRTAKTDLAADFKVLKSALANGQMNLSEWEPAEGFSDKNRRDKLRDQQKTRAQAWRSWWDSVASRATLEDGVWVTK